jgi:hypothetical protein
MNMTPQERADKLNEFNQHLAAGGSMKERRGSEWYNTLCAPNFYSEPDNWRMVPLPRKEKIYVAYIFPAKGEFCSCEILETQVEQYQRRGWKIATIEVTEGES